MKIAIDAPAKRPLTPNEKRIYDLLRQGLTPKEIAREIHMPLGNEIFCYIHEITCDTVRHLITSIREKGYTIYENEEEKPMVKYTSKQKQEALRLFDEGMTAKEISAKLGFPYKTVWLWCDGHKKENEPVQAATCTDSGVENLDSISTSIISEKTEDVKSRAYSDLTISAVYDAITQKRCEIANLTREIDRRFAAIDKVKEMIGRLDNIRAYAEFELDTMLEDYAALCGEVSE